jgi:PAS domain S-box-containing protein
LEESDQHRESAAPSSEELLRLIFESATDYAMFSIDPKGLVTSWNSGAERVLRYAQGEIMGRSADVIFTDEDQAAGIPEEERRQATAKGRAEDERWTMRKDGSRFWASGLLMPLVDRSQGFIKILRDRTERHQAAERLRESEARFRLLATSIPQLVFRTRDDGSRTWGSPQWISFTGLGLESSLGFGWLDVIHPEDRASTRAAWGEARNAGAYYVEHRVRRAGDGEYRWHQTRARPVEGAGPASDWVGTMTDIHDLRTAQARQQVLMAELQHRTRNLLAVVQAIAYQTRRNSRSLDDFGAEFESRLGALSRVQSLLARVDHQGVDLHELVGAELLAHGDGSVEGKSRVSGPPIMLSAASAQVLALALHELATNAVKYGALAHPSGELEVQWREAHDDGKHELILRWTESSVAIPQGEGARRKGYGSELIERALPYQLGAKTRLEFAPDGVRCTIILPLKERGRA